MGHKGDIMSNNAIDLSGPAAAAAISAASSLYLSSLERKPYPREPKEAKRQESLVNLSLEKQGDMVGMIAIQILKTMHSLQKSGNSRSL
jgi:hypothetical protein